MSEKGACIAANADDCAGSEACKLHGKCAAVSDACVAKTDAGCQASEDCKKQGACDAYASLKWYERGCALGSARACRAITSSRRTQPE